MKGRHMFFLHYENGIFSTKTTNLWSPVLACPPEVLGEVLGAVVLGAAVVGAGVPDAAVFGQLGSNRVCKCR